jgi:peptidylprolyl isomerase
MDGVKALMLIIAASLALFVAGCGGDSDSSSGESTASGESASAESNTESAAAEKAAAEKTKPKVTVPKGAPPKELETKDLEEGTGAEAKAGDEVTVQYVGVNYKNGKEFDSSWSRSEPFPFVLGSASVIPGWEQGVTGMKVGGRRELIIPPELAYGEAGSPPAIGPNETLVFVIDLLAVK